MTEPAEVTTEEAPATEPVVEAESSEPEDTSVLDTLDYEDPGEDEEVATTEPEPEKEIEEDKVIKSAGEILAGKEEKKEIEVKEAAEPPPETPTEPDKPTEPVAPAEVAKAPEPVVTEPEKPAPTPEEVRASVLEQMEKSYQFSEEDAELVRIEPEKALPKLAARLFVDIYEAVSHSVYTQLPTIFNNLSEQRTSSTKHEGSFFEAFPELNKPEYAEQLGRTGKFWRDQNPDASAEQAIQGIGTTAMAMLGLTKVEVLAEKTPVEPAVKPISPSVPAAAASGAGDTPKVESNEILEMLDFTEDDI